MNVCRYVELCTSSFSVQREWPLIGTAPLDDLSLGEEQSHSHGIALAWSPSHLALHQRPVLAVLTSNLLLSIWAPGNDLKDGSTWKRVVVLNNLIAARISRIPGIPDRDERLRNRIRCFAWAEPVAGRGPKHGLYSPIHEIQLLAVGNDAGEVMVLWLLCPVQGFSRWDVRVLRIVDVDNRPQQDSSIRRKGSLLSEKLDSRRPIYRLRWGARWDVDKQHTHRIWSTELFVDCEGWTTSVSLRMQLLPNADYDQRLPVLFLGDVSVKPSCGTSAMDMFLTNFARISEHYPAMLRSIRELERSHILRHGFADGVRVKVWQLVQHPIHKQWAISCVSLHPLHLLEYPSSQSGTCFIITSQGEKIEQSSQESVLGRKAVDVLKEVGQSISEYENMHSGEISSCASGKEQEWSKSVISAISEAALLQRDGSTGQERPALETCTVCNSDDIPFGYLDIAECSKGHHFSRETFPPIAS